MLGSPVSQRAKTAVAEFLPLVDPADRRKESPKGIRAAILTIVAVLAALTGIFIDRAVHIDDPLFVWAARHIQSHPADPYGFSVNWYGESIPISEVTKNPPLASYYLAATAFLLGWSEPALHFTFMFPALAAALGTYLTARRFCRHPLLAALAGILTPVFFVSSVTVMCDMLMLAFWVWGVHFWITGLDRPDHPRLAASSVLVALSALSKYFGMTLIPLLLVYSILKKRRIGPWVLYFAIPVGILTWYQWATKRLYGHGLLFDAAVYANQFGKVSLARLWVNAAFTGGCVATGLFFCRQLWPKTVLAAGAVLALAIALVLLGEGRIGSFSLPADRSAQFLIAGQLGIWGVAGLGLLALAIVDVHRHRDADSVLLASWVAGTFVFAGFVNWTTNGRSILPMIVPAGILITRRLETLQVQKETVAPSPRTLVPLLAGLALSFVVTLADSRFADTGRAAAATIRDRYPSESKPAIWFQGHWGFQYYLETVGAKPIDVKRSALARGDLIVRPTTNSNLFRLPGWAKPRESFDLPLVNWISTMNLKAGAGFYADIFGPLPFAIGPVEDERITVFAVGDP